MNTTNTFSRVLNRVGTLIVSVIIHSLIEVVHLIGADDGQLTAFSLPLEVILNLLVEFLKEGWLGSVLLLIGDGVSFWYLRLQSLFSVGLWIVTSIFFSLNDSRTWSFWYSCQIVKLLENSSPILSYFLWQCRLGRGTNLVLLAFPLSPLLRLLGRLGPCRTLSHRSPVQVGEGAHTSGIVVLARTSGWC